MSAALFQRLVPKAFACLQMYKSVQRVKHGMVQKARQMHQLQLARKTLAALIENAIKARQSNQDNRKAVVFRRKSLRKTAFRHLVSGSKQLKE